ncbi:MAG: response regulator [Kangiellaceae bacterium]|nr:response regulator [Kangiellaceae bacterium]
MRRVIPFIILLLWFNSVNSLEIAINDTHFNKLTVEQGLANRVVRAIVQDNQGYIWLGTPRGLSRFDGYKVKTFKLSSDDLDSLDKNNIQSLHVDKYNRLWVGTWDSGLNQFQNDKLIRYSTNLTDDHNNYKPLKDVFSLDSTQQYLLIASEQGVSKLDLDTNKIEKLNLNNNGEPYEDDIYNIAVLSEDSAFIAGLDMIGELNLNTGAISNINSLFPLDDRIFKALHKDQKGNIWIGTHKGLYLYKRQLKTLKKFEHPLFNTRIFGITSDTNGVYVGTFGNGVIRIDQNSNFTVFNKQQGNDSSLSDSVGFSLFIDKSNTLWIGTFNGGLNYINTQNLSLQKISPISSGFECLTNQTIYSLYGSSNQLLYIGSEAGLFKIGKDSCIHYKTLLPTDKRIRIAVIKEILEHIWIGTNHGLFTIDNKSNRLINVDEVISKSPINDIIKYGDAGLLIATSNGLLMFDTNNKIQKSVSTTAIGESVNIHQITKLNSQTYLLSTDKGLWSLNNQLDVSLFSDSLEISHKVVNTIKVTDAVFVGLEQSNTLYQFNLSGKLINQFEFEVPKDTLLDIMSIIHDGDFIWVSTDHGLFSVNIKNQEQKHFSVQDGLQSSSFIRNSSYRAPDGKLYFGGRNGFNAFYPEDIKDNLVPPKVVLTELRRFNKVVEPNMSAEDSEAMDGFSIDTPIEYLEELELGHRDYVMSLEFAGLHYADPMRNTYQYKLEGLHEDWIDTDASNRVATFTNLAPGNYVFRVRAANKDGVWSLPEDDVALNIRVNPAPWLSWWAYTLYTLFMVGAILWFIRYRTQAAVKRSQELELEVAARTKEIHTQKEVIEGLLERKNELFANISHEFRTPLTLILGPLEKELKALDSPKNPKHLTMIQRNAKRLLGMVEQILKLTELKKEETLLKLPHAVNPALEAIVESFKPLAESKQIGLSLTLDEPCNVLASNDALEVMLGNLLSNAIKYTPEGGKASLTSKRFEDKIQFSVTDTGVGMTPAQQQDIFERFVRLDKTSDIAGTGIGLSIVKELVTSHHGIIQVSSQEGQGSTFTLTLPTTEQAATNDSVTLQSISHLVSTEPQEHQQTVSHGGEQGSLNQDQDTVLVIEDNPDMRDYIAEVLSAEYHCLTADRGQAGLDIAIEQVPDLIICDVMMPGLNGYEVARQLRDDERTSHIPIVLLTAKGDKHSRIQGWNENIDDYMTKPFDEQELQARISNILSVRNILRRKAGQELIQNAEHTQPLANASLNNNPELPESSQQAQPEAQPERTLNKKEQAFVDKLMTVITNNYSNPDFQRKDMAALMFISERQLQRKIKSLIDQNPNDILREYRLNQAAKLLKEGEQVTTVALECGYHSISSFSKVFKAHFETPPKKYS